LKKILIPFFILFVSCTPAEVTELTSGEEIYTSRCSACHGSDFSGRVGPSLNMDSKAAQMPDSYWVQTITKGMGSMPAQRLSDNEVILVINFIKGQY
jgi:mono/diheme cytochrome c family protein|tara:strand:- start:185 stop:475 length:291 start_codon:yes stop_codon:yes gene_type:complete